MNKCISIITINYNNGLGLELTAKSIISQSFQDFEWIVIDGGSTDNSIEIIKRYENRMNYHISEKDSGIYNAMNKGINFASGNYCLFLNSGDRLHDAKVIERIHKYCHIKKYDFIIGQLQTEDEKGIRNMWNFPKTIDGVNLFKYSLPHPSTFINTELLKKHPYRENYRIVSDWLFFMEMIIKYNKSYIVLNNIISIYNLGGISSDGDLCKNEKEKGFIEIFGNQIFCDYSRLIYGKTSLEKNIRYLEQYKYFGIIVLLLTNLLVKIHKILIKI